MDDPIFENGVLAIQHPNFHVFSTKNRSLVLDVESGTISKLGGKLPDENTLSKEKRDAIEKFIEAELAENRSFVGTDEQAPAKVSIQSLSLAIAQKCNLGCTYCYAEQGTFGGKPDNMSIEVAKASVDRLFQDAPADQRITLAFMGGEPLFNRKALHETTAYAVEKARQLGREVAFTITTNATLIRPEDIALFQEHRFTVTVSIDGIGKSNDSLRPYISGKGSFERVKEKLQQLLSVHNRSFQVLGRVTVTPKNLNLVETFQGLLELGMDSVQFSPMLKSPTGKEEMAREDFNVLLEQLMACGEQFRQGFLNRQLLPLKNVLSTLGRIHNYQREMYPCGAGGGYMGVSAEGELYACHRFVNDDDGHMGDLENGVDPAKQGQWLKDRHLQAQGACNSCWARHLCSGSCHHEVIKRGRPACDYIRGWLHYCLGLYVDLMEADPVGLRLLLGDQEVLANTSEEDDGTGLAY